MRDKQDIKQALIELRDVMRKHNVIFDPMEDYLSAITIEIKGMYFHSSGEVSHEDIDKIINEL